MRELASGVDLGGLPNTLDIVGTGGDASGTFNISTAGCHVAKHGNRSVSSKSGSADVLEAAGIRLGLTPDQVARCVREVGVGFMFAPAHHGAMKHAIGPRKELGVRTLFNLLGPLTNPAGVPNQLLGVFRADLLEPLAQVLQRLGSRHLVVVHSRDGLDEISIGDETQVAELKDGEIRRFSIAPEEFGIPRAPLDAIRVEGPQAKPGHAPQCAGGPAWPGPGHRGPQRRCRHLCGRRHRQPGGRRAVGGHRYQKRRGARPAGSARGADSGDGLNIDQAVETQRTRRANWIGKRRTNAGHYL